MTVEFEINFVFQIWANTPPHMGRIEEIEATNEDLTTNRQKTGKYYTVQIWISNPIKGCF